MLASDIALDDSKGMCEFLAQAALTCLKHPDKRSIEFGVLPNVYRLLEMYRHDIFEDDQPPGILAAIVLEEGAIGTRTGTVGRPWSHDIKQAMDAARHVAFGDSSKSRAVKELQQLIRSISRGQAPERLPAQKTRQARQFFKSLSSKLHAA